MSDPFEGITPSPTSHGTVDVPIVKSDVTDIAPEFPKALEVIGIGGGSVLRFMPVGSDRWVTVDPVYVGYVTKFRVRRVSTATTCDVVGVSD